MRRTGSGQRPGCRQPSIDRAGRLSRRAHGPAAAGSGGIRSETDGHALQATPTPPHHQPYAQRR
eukprot:5844275-Alexandrium_andersonii.AAC.1